MARTQGGGDRGGRRRGEGDRAGREESELREKLVSINRVAKVVKGGRRFGFAAVVVVGDGKGRVGFGTGKAREVPEAIRKATDQAKRSMVRIPLREGRTLHHDVEGRYGAGMVVMRTAKPGTGIIAGGPMRAIFESLGLQDVVAKSIGSSNPHNMIKATFAAFRNMASPRAIAAKRGKKVGDIVGRRDGDAAAAAAAARE
jgi:small subunit ribosomal protein S5